MPVLPLIDLLILIAWTSLVVGFVQKVLWLALASRFTILGLQPFDFVTMAGVGLLFALALAARVWVKTHEPAMLRAARRGPGRGVEALPDFPDPREEREPRVGVVAGGDGLGAADALAAQQRRS